MIALPRSVRHGFVLCLVLLSSSGARASFSECASAYTSWTAGTQPSTAQLAAWVMVNSQKAGGSISSSSSNGGTGWIDTNGKAFSINAGGAGRTFVSTQFTQGVLQQGQSFGVYVDAGTSIDTFGLLGLASHPVGGGGYGLGPNIQMNGGGNYEVSGNGLGYTGSNIPVSEPVDFVITNLGSGQYAMSLTSLTSSKSFSGTFSSSAAVDTFYAQVDGEPNVDPLGALIFNGIRMDAPAPAIDKSPVPEPGSLAVLGLVFSTALLRRRK